MLLIIVNNVLAFIGIGGSLAGLLVVADYFLANYGDCNIDINNGKKKITVKGGNSLLGSLAENNLFIPSACGGKGTCGLCKVEVLKGSGPILPTEKPYLNEVERKDGVRLSCQIKVKEDLLIVIPQSLFAIKKFLGQTAEIVDYTYDTKGIFIKLTDPKEIEFKAGQYLQLESKKYPKVKEKVIRAYSIASAPSNTGKVELIIRLVPDGIMTTYTHKHLQKGDDISFTGPYGDFYIRDTEAEMIFVAGGSGMAPFKAIIADLKEKESKRKITYFFGARTEKDLYLTNEMKAYEKSLANFTYIPVISQPQDSPDWKGLTGYIPPLLKEYVKDPKNTEGYLCGSPGLLNVTEKALKELGVEKVYYDSFG